MTQCPLSLTELEKLAVSDTGTFRSMILMKGYRVEEGRIDTAGDEIDGSNKFTCIKKTPRDFIKCYFSYSGGDRTGFDVSCTTSIRQDTYCQPEEEFTHRRI